jgi:hypothetical protein
VVDQLMKLLRGLIRIIFFIKKVIKHGFSIIFWTVMGRICTKVTRKCAYQCLRLDGVDFLIKGGGFIFFHEVNAQNMIFKKFTSKRNFKNFFENWNCNQRL